MEKSLHICSIKRPCRIQIVFGLCLAMLFTFLVPSFNTSATYPYTSWGAFDGSGEPVQMFDNNVDISLTHMIELSFNQTVIDSSALTSLGVSYSSFVSSLNYFGVSNLLANWQAGNPSFFLNIGYITYRDRYYYALYFTKYNGKSSYSPSVSGNDSIQLNNDGDLYFSFYCDQIIQAGSSLSTSNGTGSGKPYAKSVVIESQLNGSGENSASLFINGSTYTAYYNLSATSSNVLNRFTSFLNSFDDFLFCVLVPDVNSYQSGSLQYFVNTSILQTPNNNTSTNSHRFPIFSTIFSYDYYASDVSATWTSYSYFIYFLPYLNRFSTGIVLQDTNDIFSYGYQYGGTSGIITPTPIPTYAWTTPTPFPNVTFIPATLTPIVVQYDPYIYGSDDTWDNLAGYLGILNTALKSPVNRFFSTIMQVTYSFSDWFKFMLVVPIICLFAFIIGRLKRK